MDIKRSGSQPSGKGPGDYFTGTVRIGPLFEAPEPARVDWWSPDHSPLPKRLHGLSVGLPGTTYSWRNDPRGFSS